MKTRIPEDAGSELLRNRNSSVRFPRGRGSRSNPWEPRSKSWDAYPLEGDGYVFLNFELFC